MLYYDVELKVQCVLKDVIERKIRARVYPLCSSIKKKVRKSSTIISHKIYSLVAEVDLK